MATRYVNRGPFAAQNRTGSHAGLEVKQSDNLLYCNADGTPRPIGSQFTKVVTASGTLTAAESGVTVIADSTTSVVMTLPATQAGLEYTLVVGQLTGSAGHAFSPNASDQIIGATFTPADDKDAVCSAATDVVGDLMTLVGDGSLGWYVKAKIGTWARES